MTFWETLKLAIPIVVAVVAWVANEYSKRRWEDYLRKETSFKALLLTLKGFYVTTANREQKQAFLDQLNICWLYCSDDVIRKAYGFLTTVHTDAGKAATDKAETEKKQALGELVLSVRKDLLSRRRLRRTNLTSDDFKHYIVT